jgi:hypothetical protein
VRQALGAVQLHCSTGELRSVVQPRSLNVGLLSQLAGVCGSEIRFGIVYGRSRGIQLNVHSIVKFWVSSLIFQSSYSGPPTF